MSSILRFKNCKLKVALLGGSYDPPHEGHFAISEMLIKKGFDYVWWIVAKQNPLKANPLNNFNSRVKLSKLITHKNPKILVTDIENQIVSNCSFDIIMRLKKLFPNISFAWAMGADNLVNFHNWFQARKIAHLLPIVVFNRNQFFYKSLSSRTKKIFRNNVSINFSEVCFNNFKLPWLYILKQRNYDFSSTNIRLEKSSIYNIDNI